MANDCLVTKLKSVVNNDNLQRFGEINFTLSPSASGDNLLMIIGKAKFSQPVTYNGTTIDANTWINSTQKVLIKSTSSSQVTVSLERYKYIQFLDIYRLPTERVSLDDFAYMTIDEIRSEEWQTYKGNINSVRCGRFQLTSDYITGNIDEVSVVTTNNPIFILQGANLAGTGIVFAANIGLTQLMLMRVPNSVSPEAFAQAQVEAGRTSGTLNYYSRHGSKKIMYDSSYTGGYQIQDI